MSKKYILSLDQGTSSSRSLLFDKSTGIVGWEQAEFNQYYPKAGWVEHDPLEIWETQINTAKNLIKNKNIDINDIAALGIANQRETIVLCDKNSGVLIYRAIVWKD